MSLQELRRYVRWACVGESESSEAADVVAECCTQQRRGAVVQCKPGIRQVPKHLVKRKRRNCIPAKPSRDDSVEELA